MLILHGAGYYDSADWIDVAGAVATGGRTVVAYDARGYGRSGWSTSGDYGIDTQLADITALLDHLAWARPVLLGHSRGGSFALRYVAGFPHRLGAVIFADSCPGRTARGPAAPAGGAGVPQHGPAAACSPAEPVYPTLAAALASTSRDPRSLEDPAKLVRLEEIFAPVEGGYQLGLRDPRFQSGGGGGAFDGWAALAAITVPALFIRAARSLSFDDAAWTRAQAAVPDGTFVTVSSGHDLANEVPGEMAAVVSRFLSA